MPIQINEWSVKDKKHTSTKKRVKLNFKSKKKKKNTVSPNEALEIILIDLTTKYTFEDLSVNALHKRILETKAKSN